MTSTHSAFRSMFLVVVFIASVIGLAGSCRAELYHSTQWGYSINPPSKWMQVPETNDKLRNIQQAISNSKEAAERVVIDTAFQRKSPQWMAMPFIIIQVIPYDRLGLSGPIPESQFSEVVRGISEGGNKSGNPSWQKTNPVLDKPNRRFTWTTDVDTREKGKIRTYLTGYFGSKAMIQIAYVCPLDDVNMTIAERKAIFESFQFDADSSYSDAPPSRKRVFTTERAIAIVVGVGMLGGIFVVIALLLQRIFKQ